MGERRGAENSRSGGQSMLARAQAAVAEHGAVGVRHGLGRRRRAGRIEKQERVARIGRRVIGRQRIGGLEFGERVGAGEEKLGATVREDGLDLRAAIGHVHRAHHGAQARDGEMHDQELGRIRKLQRDHVARANAELVQALRDAQHAALELAPRELARGRGDRRRFGTRRGVTAQPLPQRVVVAPPAARDVLALLLGPVGRTLHRRLY